MRVRVEVKGRVESLHLEPGDTVVATLDDGAQLSPADIDEIQSALADEFPANKVLVLRGIALSKAVAS